MAPPTLRAAAAVAALLAPELLRAAAGIRPAGPVEGAAAAPAGPHASVPVAEEEEHGVWEILRIAAPAALAFGAHQLMKDHNPAALVIVREGASLGMSIFCAAFLCRTVRDVALDVLSVAGVLYTPEVAAVLGGTFLLGAYACLDQLAFWLRQETHFEHFACTQFVGGQCISRLNVFVQAISRVAGFALLGFLSELAAVAPLYGAAATGVVVLGVAAVALVALWRVRAWTAAFLESHAVEPTLQEEPHEWHLTATRVEDDFLAVGLSFALMSLLRWALRLLSPGLPDLELHQRAAVLAMCLALFCMLSPMGPRAPRQRLRQGLCTALAMAAAWSTTLAAQALAVPAAEVLAISSNAVLAAAPLALLPLLGVLDSVADHMRPEMAARLLAPWAVGAGFFLGVTGDVCVAALIEQAAAPFQGSKVVASPLGALVPLLLQVAMLGAAFPLWSEVVAPPCLPPRRCPAPAAKAATSK